MPERWRSVLAECLFRDNELSERNGLWFARLREDGQQAKLKTVELQAIPAGSLLIRLDACKPLKGLFKASTEALHRCDYVLIAPHNNRIFIIFIELKSKAFTLGEIEEKFKSSACLWDYCDSVMKELLGHTDIKQVCVRRYVLFHNNYHRFNKQPLSRRTSGSKAKYKPLPFLPMPVTNKSRPYFKQIIGGI